MNLTAWAPRITSDRVVAAAASRRGIELRPLSQYYAGEPRQGFILGFASAAPSEIRAAVQQIGPLLRDA
jgi:DNA-binding transcriptional MocR family regulator